MFVTPTDSIFSVIKKFKVKNNKERIIKNNKGRIIKLKEAKEQNGFKQMWFIDGKVLFKEDDGLIQSLTTRSRLLSFHVCMTCIALFIFWDYFLEAFYFCKYYYP